MIHKGDYSQESFLIFQFWGWDLWRLGLDKSDSSQVLFFVYDSWNAVIDKWDS